MLSVNDESWEIVWLNAWTSTPAYDQQYEWLEKEQACVRVPAPQAPADWITNRLKAIALRIRRRRIRIQPLVRPPSASPRSLLLPRLGAGRSSLPRPAPLPNERSSRWVKIGDAAMQVWDTMGHNALQQWKTTWDECDKLSAQYGTVITTTMMATISERLADVAPEQITFGDPLKHGEGLEQSENPSLQDFIRSRMQEHFEMVDKYGFGSFQELVTTAEEAMCEIWVASLDIIESNRYQS
ncbi:unnamed protein product [Rhizoctonia solani]|uniref:Uncharacterized protein n=1 Tax=Rhizoctonia solani TaxID=456999 RepID=A0A8H2WYY3_9AGAM|nr:unnamed protein product [Rhizoctonia solani]